MLFKKIELAFIVTLFAIVLTTLVYISPPRYTSLWLNLEIIIIPVFYLIGYELMLDKQQNRFEERLRFIRRKAEDLERKNAELRFQLTKKSS